MVKETYVFRLPPHYAQHSSSAYRKYYDLLEVQPSASESDLKKAYRKK
jgi:hypothetical protein